MRRRNLLQAAIGALVGAPAPALLAAPRDDTALLQRLIDEAAQGDRIRPLILEPSRTYVISGYLTLPRGVVIRQG